MYMRHPGATIKGAVDKYTLLFIFILKCTILQKYFKKQVNPKASEIQKTTYSLISCVLFF